MLKKFRDVFVNSFAFYLAIELVEDLIEHLITFGISSLILKCLATFSVVSVNYSTKAIIKTMVRKITYKEGNDKVNKLKQFFTWIYCNKKTLGGYVTAIGTAVVASLDGTGVTDVGSLAPLFVSGFNITPILFYVVLALVNLLGVSDKGWEKIVEFFSRKKEEKAVKEAKAIEKEAKKEILAERKLANQTKAEKEKAEAKAEEDAKAKAEKEKAEAEHKAKVEEAKKNLLLAEVENNSNQNNA